MEVTALSTTAIAGPTCLAFRMTLQITKCFQWTDLFYNYRHYKEKCAVSKTKFLATWSNLLARNLIHANRKLSAQKEIAVMNERHKENGDCGQERGKYTKSLRTDQDHPHQHWSKIDHHHSVPCPIPCPHSSTGTGDKAALYSSHQ